MALRRVPRPSAPQLVAALALSLVACGDDGAPTPAPEDAAARIAVVPKGTTHSFWQAVERGARRAGDELGVEVIFKAQLDEGDRAGQIQVVQQLVGQGVDALCLAPLDSRALVRPVADARALGLPVIVFDSPLEGEAGADYRAYVGTDNEAAGRLAGEALAEEMGGAGEVVMLRYRVGSASTEARERGLLAALAAYPDIEVRVHDRYAGASSSAAQSQALAMLPTLRAADGVFCSAEPSTAGMLLALRREGLLEDLAFVGFDASPPLVEALRQGEIDALVVQDPERMGELTVRLAKRALDGAAVAAMNDTGAVLVRASDLDDPRFAAIVE